MRHGGKLTGLAAWQPGNVGPCLDSATNPLRDPQDSLPVSARVWGMQATETHLATLGKKAQH